MKKLTLVITLMSVLLYFLMPEKKEKELWGKEDWGETSSFTAFVPAQQIKQIAKKPSQYQIKKGLKRKFSKAPVPEKSKARVVSRKVEEFELKLVDVFNSKLYTDPLRGSDFEGELQIRVEGPKKTIKYFQASIPNVEVIEFSNIGVSQAGTFNFSYQGRDLSGLVYQHARHPEVHLINIVSEDELKGTRLKFVISSKIEDHFQKFKFANTQDEVKEVGSSVAPPETDFDGNPEEMQEDFERDRELNQDEPELDKNEGFAPDEPLE